MYLQRQGPLKESQFVWSLLWTFYCSSLLNLLLFPSISVQNRNDLQSAVSVYSQII